MASTTKIRRWINVRRGLNGSGEEKVLTLGYIEWYRKGETVISATAASSDTAKVTVGSASINNEDAVIESITHPASTVVSVPFDVVGGSPGDTCYIEVRAVSSNPEHVDIEPVGIRIVG